MRQPAQVYIAAKCRCGLPARRQLACQVILQLAWSSTRRLAVPAVPPLVLCLSYAAAPDGWRKNAHAVADSLPKTRISARSALLACVSHRFGHVHQLFETKMKTRRNRSAQQPSTKSSARARSARARRLQTWSLWSRRGVVRGAPLRKKRKRRERVQARHPGLDRRRHGRARSGRRRATLWLMCVGGAAAQTLQLLMTGQQSPGLVRERARPRLARRLRDGGLSTASRSTGHASRGRWRVPPRLPAGPPPRVRAATRICSPSVARVGPVSCGRRSSSAGGRPQDPHAKMFDPIVAVPTRARLARRRRRRWLLAKRQLQGPRHRLFEDL